MSDKHHPVIDASITEIGDRVHAVTVHSHAPMSDSQRQMDTIQARLFELLEKQLSSQKEKIAEQDGQIAELSARLDALEGDGK